MYKFPRFGRLSLVAVTLALGMSLSGAGMIHASPNATSGARKQEGHCPYQVQVVKSPNPGSSQNYLWG
ncbi:MAG TPA: hypothetical protein VL485_31565 [Ktedonobacteraceae bacterium]|jgi:hypothetical protein|nr:hypothetical protein [Ktedonobacteraceae bacterium]